MLGHFVLFQDLPLKCWDTSYCSRTFRPIVGPLCTVLRPLTQVLGHFALSQDYLLKCWDTSYCPKTPHSSVRTLRTAPGSPWSSVRTLRTVPGPLTRVLGHFALSQDLSPMLWDTSHCPKTSLLKCWDTSYCSKTSHSSVGKLRTVPRPFVQVLGQSDLFFFFGVGTLRSLSPVPPLKLCY